MFVSFYKMRAEAAACVCICVCPSTRRSAADDGRGQRLDPRFTTACHVSASTDAVVTPLSTALCDTWRSNGGLCRLSAVVCFLDCSEQFYCCFILSFLSFCVSSAPCCLLTCALKYTSLPFCARLDFCETIQCHHITSGCLDPRF